MSATENKQIINLTHVFQIPPEKPIKSFKSLFLYIFLLFELVIVILICAFFFKKEIIFIYHSLFQKEVYSLDDKRKYNEFMFNVKSIIETPKYCLFIPSVENKNHNNETEKITNKYFAMFRNNQYMKALNGDRLYFDDEESCNKFLSS